jgi:inosine-uridine nucleoside N-ribohydrolase
MILRKYVCLFLLLPFFVLGQNPSTKKQKVIFDCDLGDDIDDAYALAYLLTLQSDYEILGITTCYGRTEDRALLAKKFLVETGQTHIPVYAGRNTSSSSTRANWYADQFYWAKGFKPESRPAETPKPRGQGSHAVSTVRSGSQPPEGQLSTQKNPSAAHFITEMLQKYPGEIIVFSVGPVTNLADVEKAKPGTLRLSKKIYAMFGSFRSGYAPNSPIDPEWNVLCDIPSAQMFVQSGANIAYAGLDVTSMVKLDRGKRDILLQRQSPLTNALSGLYVLWGQETPTLFDPVAIAMAKDPSLVSTEKVHVYVDEKGYTRIDPTKPPNAEIGTKIDVKKFLDQLMRLYVTQSFSPKNS